MSAKTAVNSDCTIFDSSPSVIFSDVHYGMKNDDEKYLELCDKSVDFVCSVAKERKAGRILFLGDFFDSRSSLDVRTIAHATDAIRRLTSICPLYIILGNHDTYLKNDNSINSLSVYGPYANVVLIRDSVFQAKFVGDGTGRRFLFFPWGFHVKDEAKKNFGTADAVFGHLAFGKDFFLKAYSAENSGEYGKETSDGVSDIVQFAKPETDGGVVFSGHIHQRKEFTMLGRKTVIVGSPFETYFGYNDSETCGCYIHHPDTNKYEFVLNEGYAKHLKLTLSSILDGGGSSGFDFSIVKGKIVRMVIDRSVTYPILSEISSKVSSSGAFILENPEYMVAISSSDQKAVAEAGEIVAKSKLSYVTDGICGIFESKDVKDSRLDRKYLTEKAEEVYAAAAEDENGIQEE
jgi:hypothetical protein